MSTTTTPTLDSNQLAAVKRATEWLKIAGNNINNGRAVLIAHDLDHERVDSLLEEIQQVVRNGEEAVATADRLNRPTHKEVKRHARTDTQG